MRMVRRNLREFEGKRIVVEGTLEKTYKRGHDNCLVKDIVIRRNGKKEDHIWVCNEGHEGNDIVRRVLEKVGQQVGDSIVIRGVVKTYTKRGVVDYCIEDIDAIGVNGRNFVRNQ
jgi:hypothetical protein